jgi:hypothetical protein
MKNQLIKNYTSWINEAVEATALSTTAPAVDGIAFISASTSASNITDQLASNIGIKKDTVYTLTMQNIASLRFIDTDGSKFGGAQAQTRITINLDSTQKTAKPGDDMLEINGRKLLETGTIFLKKTDLTGPITITASNNGMLALVRFANSQADMATRFKFYLGNCQNFVLKFTLGNPVAEADARGFSYYWAKPNQLSPISNMIAASISVNLLNTLGLPDHIAQTDPVIGPYFTKFINGKDASTATNEIANGAAGFVKGNRMLVNNPIPDIGAAWTGLSAADLKTVVTYNESSKKFKLLPEGLKRLTAVFTKIAEAIAPTKSPVEFGNDGAAVFAGYTEIIKNGLLSKSSGLNDWFDRVQSVQAWSGSSSSPGGGGTGGKKQGEGQVGRG